MSRWIGHRAMPSHDSGTGFWCYRGWRTSPRGVATKFMNVARAHYARKGLHADLIKLYGSMELAPLMGLADEIVDIVDTGKTLAENGMAPKN